MTSLSSLGSDSIFWKKYNETQSSHEYNIIIRGRKKKTKKKNINAKWKICIL